MGKHKKKQNAPTQEQIQDFKAQYLFAKSNCKHAVTAKTVAAALKIAPEQVYGLMNNRNTPHIDAITAEYRRQIAAFIAAKTADVGKLIVLNSLTK